MPKDRDQLTPEEPEDTGQLRPHRSAAIEAEDANDSEWGPGPASRGSDPPAREEVDTEQKDNYR